MRGRGRRYTCAHEKMFIHARGGLHACERCTSSREGEFRVCGEMFKSPPKGGVNGHQARRTCARGTVCVSAGDGMGAREEICRSAQGVTTSPRRTYTFPRAHALHHSRARTQCLVPTNTALARTCTFPWAHEIPPFRARTLRHVLTPTMRICTPMRTHLTAAVSMCRG